MIYDQSPQGNHLTIAPPGGHVHQGDKPVNASRHPITLGGQPVYGAYFEGGMGYRNDNTTGVATGNEPETIYMVTSGTHYNGGCCFDYGNAETNAKDDGAGTMEAVYFGNSSTYSHGPGKGPWVMADLENGLWAGDNKTNPNNQPITTEYVTAMLKGGVNGFALKGNDATVGTLQTMYDGPRPTGGWTTPKKQGAIILGIGGDNSNKSIGTFYEGIMTQGYSTDVSTCRYTPTAVDLLCARPTLPLPPSPPLPSHTSTPYPLTAGCGRRCTSEYRGRRLRQVRHGRQPVGRSHIV